MTGERSYTTKIWRQPSSIEFSSADALSTSTDPPGEPVISTRKRPCQKIQNGSEFPELVAQNSRNPHRLWRRSVSVFRELEEGSPYNGLERLERQEGPSPRDSRLFIRVLKDRQTANDSSH